MRSEEPRRIASYEINVPGEVAIVGSGVVIKASFEEEGEDFGDGKSSVLLDATNMSFPLKIRPRIQGNCFYPYGFGKRKKLQDFFVDEKVPRDERDAIPIIVSGNDIVWIAGYRGDERFKVTEGTERFLRLEFRR